VILVGICAGGWQAAVFAALHPSKVEKLVTVAAPIDYEAEGGLNAFYQNLPIEFFQGMVDMGGGIMDGQLIVSGYKSMHFIDRYIKDGCDLYWKIKDGNDDGVQKQIDFIAWYDKGTSKMPGKYYMEVIDMFKHNKLVKGQMIVNRQAVNLTDIRCPVIVVTGSEDDVTGEGQAVGLREFVKDFTHYEIPGVGHFGSFSGAGSMKHWKERIFEGVANA
jgi:poly(3-hydroxyalkanoate) synthetase